MTSRRTLAIALSPLLIGLAACGSSNASDGTQSVKDAQAALQTSLIAGDAKGACLHVDEAALKAQIAKASPAAKNATCETIMTTVIAFAKSSGQQIKPFKDIKVLTQNTDSATVQVTNSDGKVQVSTWKLEGGVWKVVSTK